MDDVTALRDALLEAFVGREYRGYRTIEQAVDDLIAAVEARAALTPASAILAASLARALSLGVAWLAAEAALPEGWIVSAVGITGVIGTDGKPEAWQAEAIQTTGYDFWAGEDPAEDAEAVGPTPESALAALAAALRKEQK